MGVSHQHHPPPNQTNPQKYVNAAIHCQARLAQHCHLTQHNHQVFKENDPLGALAIT